PRARGGRGGGRLSDHPSRKHRTGMCRITNRILAGGARKPQAMQELDAQTHRGEQWAGWRRGLFTWICSPLCVCASSRCPSSGTAFYLTRATATSPTTCNEAADTLSIVSSVVCQYG